MGIRNFISLLTDGSEGLYGTNKQQVVALGQVMVERGFSKKMMVAKLG
jgi:hypothetical protein